MSALRSLGPSAGRVKAIAPGQNFGFVHDFRMDADVFALFEFPGQAFPHELIRYELFDQGENGKSRLRAEDIQFYPRLTVDEVLGWARQGLAKAGLEWLKREIARQPDLVSRVFGPETSAGVKERLLSDGAFPLPATLVEKALADPRWQRHALPRLGRVKHWTPALFGLLFESGLREEEFLRLLGMALEQNPSLPLETGQTPRVKARQVYGAWRSLGNPALLLLLPRLQPSREDALALAAQLEEKPALVQAFRAHDEGRSWRTLLSKRWIEGEPEALPAQVLGDPVLPDLLLECLGGPHHGRALTLLKELPALDGTRLAALLPRLSDPQDRAWALQGLARIGNLPADLPEDVRWHLVEGGGALSLLDPLPVDGMDEPRLKTVMLRPDGLEYLKRRGLGDERLVALGRALLGEGFDPQARTAFLHWLGHHPEAPAWVEQGLAAGGDSFTQALEMAAGLPAFDRAFVQRVLLLPMTEAQRTALAQAISARNPERWQEMYLISDEEKAAWRQAGAPLQ
jgi:hypothetical protein